MAQPNADSWFVGIDLGTSSCKAAAIDQQGRVLGNASGRYPGAGTAVGWQERAPEAVLQGMIACTRAVVADAGAPAETCGGISIGGTLHSLLAVDADDRPLTNIMTWTDSRAARQAARVRERQTGSILYAHTGCPVHAMYPLYKIMWLRENRPDVFKRAARFISSKEYVVARLTGEHLVDYAIASGTGLLDIHTLDWSEHALAQAGATPARLNPLYDPRHRIDGLNPELAAAMGLTARTPLILGASDAVNSNIGAGCVRPEQATCMIGTSGALRVISSEPRLDPAGRTWCYAIDSEHWLIGGALSNGGLALDWFRRLLESAQSPRGDTTGLDFEAVLSLAAQVPPGAGGLLCLPLLVGERSPHWNPHARGLFFGVAAEHEVRHFARALLEGVAFQMRSVQAALQELTGKLHEVRVSGGVGRSPLWLQILASVLGRQLEVPRWADTSSLGAAFWALLGTAAIQSLGELEHLVPLGDSYTPATEAASLYDELYDLYGQLYHQVENLFDPIVALQGGLTTTRG
jgi:gluconokinase